MDMEPGMEILLRTEGGEEVPLHYPETSHAGANIGSIKKVVERLEAREGDLLTLVFNTREGRLEAVLTRQEELTPGWETVGRLTGLGAEAGLQRLAWAVMPPEEQVRAALWKRGDRAVLQAVPPAEKNPLKERTPTN